MPDEKAARIEAEPSGEVEAPAVHGPPLHPWRRARSEAALPLNRWPAGWDRIRITAVLLFPLSLLYAVVVRVRRSAYRTGWLQQRTMPVPVIVVGNVTVGGSGKTPLVAWIVDLLRSAGYRPGIVSRGFGGAAIRHPRTVFLDSDPGEVGDEPLLLRRRCGVPVVVCADRVSAAEHLLANQDCDIIVADDGLQHLRLGRDMELSVRDSERGYGNGLCLPAGPLREPIGVLQGVDFLICNGGDPQNDEAEMHLVGEWAQALEDPLVRRRLVDFQDSPVHAVAGIGNPARFFAFLRRFDLSLREHSFPDHHAYGPGDLEFCDSLPVLMTEKDAVKCQTLRGDRYWVVPVTAKLPVDFGARLLARLEERWRVRCEGVSA